MHGFNSVDCDMYYVYIIETVAGTYYTGMTNDLSRRLIEHASDSSRSAAYLRMHRPIYVVYINECTSRSDAMRLEYKIKNDYDFKISCIGPRRDIREVIDTELGYK